MIALGSWIKRQLSSFISSLPEIMKGILLFFLSLSGYLTGLILRFLGYNGIMILSLGALVQFISIILILLFFKNFIKSNGEKQRSKGDKKFK